jgi:hypothetical protein
MQLSDGISILGTVRNYYKQGLKSSNKYIALNEAQLRDKKLAEKATMRFENTIQAGRLIAAYRNGQIDSPGQAGNCGEMAQMAGRFAVQAGSGAHLCGIEPPGDHMFCAVDYPRDARRPAHVEDMAICYYEEALVIDPWMNICCHFKDYPERARLKLKEWSRDGKFIMYGKGQNDFALVNPGLDPGYQNGFFRLGPLRFYECRG